MKITFVVPATGKKPGEKYIGTWKMEPLTIAVLNSLTPEGVDTEFFDDRIELIDYNTKTDLVVITIETYTAKRGYQIATEFRRRGVSVVMGGYHTTLNCEEVGQFADSVVVGNAERVWRELIDDFRSNKLKTVYRGTTCFTEIPPNKEIFKGKKYLPISLVETGRGCGHACDFCAIAGYYHCRHYCRDHDQIISDLSHSRTKYHFLVDDNLVADRQNAKALFERMSSLNIKWAGQGTLSMAKDLELLKNMKKSGCEIILIGFESLNEDNLRQMNKSWILTMGERDEMVNRIHSAGIGIYATFVFGYDGDTARAFDDTLAFAKKHKFYMAAFNHLVPFPGTPLYNRLKQTDRLIYDKWWLAENYSYGELAFRPKNMSAEQLSALCRQARKEFSSTPVVLRRGLSAMSRSGPATWAIFWAANLRVGGEIDEKFNVPIGMNLDELPK